MIEDDNYHGDEFVITTFINTLRNGLMHDSTDFVTTEPKTRTD